MKSGSAFMHGTAVIAVVFTLAYGCRVQAEAPRRNLLSGDVAFEEEQKNKDPYQAEQESAIQFFKEMEARVKEAQKSGNIRAATLAPGALHYLTGAYLYCSSRAGTCPLIQ